MLYRLDENEWINTQQVCSVKLVEDVSDKFYFIVQTTDGYNHYSKNFDDRSRAMTEINYISELIKEYI